MPAPEVFHVESKENQPPLQVNVEAFKNPLQSGVERSEEVKRVTNTIQSRLNSMQKKAEGRWNMNSDEFRLAVLAMNAELNRSVPSNFKEVYDQAKSPEEAARIITQNILKNVHDYLSATTKDVISSTTGQTRKIPVGPSRADYIADQAANLSVVSVNKEEAVAYLRGIDPNITDQEVNNIWAQFKPGNAITDAGRGIARGSNMRRSSDEAMNMR